MNSTAVFSDTEINQAKLISKLSNKPAKVANDVFIWNGVLIDRASAIVALLKVNNQVPVSDGVKAKLYTNYEKRFEQYKDRITINSDDRDPGVVARVWFHRLCNTVKTSELLKNDEVKHILIALHTE